MNRPHSFVLSLLVLCAPQLFLMACAKPDSSGNVVNNSVSPKPQAGNESTSQTSATPSVNKFHLTGVLLLKDRTPATDHTVMLQEISNREATIKFEVRDNKMQPASPHARTDASGHFDIEIDPADDKKEFGLTVLDLSPPRPGDVPRPPPFLSTRGKRITFTLGGPPREIALGDVVIK